MNIYELEIGTPIMVKESRGDYWSEGKVIGKGGNYVEIRYSRGFHGEWERLYMHYRNTIVEREFIVIR